MTDPDIAAAFKRLEEWRAKEPNRAASLDWPMPTHEKIPCEKFYLELYENDQEVACGMGDTFPAAVDAALKQLEKDNG